MSTSIARRSPKVELFERTITMDDDPPNSAAATTPLGLLLCRDLFFTSKIAGTASALGLKMESAGSAADAVARISAKSYRCLFINLDEPGLDIAALLRDIPAEPRPTVIAFAAHVAESSIDAARSAGCDQVLSRGMLSSTLPELLRRFVV
jgi:CheY-like chemotaxis protein